MSPGRKPTAARRPDVEVDPTSLPRLLATADDPGFEAHFRRWGRMPAGGHLLIDEVERAGVHGRGGASFPLARKMRAVSASAGGIGGIAGRRPVVLANGAEGEPASIKDETLLTCAPHLVIDGASIAAETVGATEAIVSVDRRATNAVRAVKRALREREAVGADKVRIRLEMVPARYVASEESALVNWLNGGDAKPTFVPPRPFQKGVEGRPTLVNNVETLADLALVARFGADWFRAVGTAHDPGSMLVSVLGDVERPGVYEFATGTPMATVFRSAGTGTSAHSVLAGGYAGTWVPGQKAAGLALDRLAFSDAGVLMGCGSFFVIDARWCGLASAARVARWMAGESAGQCGPCTYGLPSIASALEAISAGDSRGRWEPQLRRWLDMVVGRGACHHPDGAVRMVRSALDTFHDDVAAHLGGRPCGRAPAPMPFPEDPSWR